MGRLINIATPLLPIAVGLLNAQADEGDRPEKALETTTVESSHISQLGIADAASTSIVTEKQLWKQGWFYRLGKVLETTPALHSGEVKANLAL